MQADRQACRQTECEFCRGTPKCWHSSRWTLQGRCSHHKGHMRSEQALHCQMQCSTGGLGRRLCCDRHVAAVSATDLTRDAQAVRVHEVINQPALQAFLFTLNQMLTRDAQAVGVHEVVVVGIARLGDPTVVRRAVGEGRQSCSELSIQCATASGPRSRPRGSCKQSQAIAEGR